MVGVLTEFRGETKNVETPLSQIGVSLSGLKAIVLLPPARQYPHITGSLLQSQGDLITEVYLGSR